MTRKFSSVVFVWFKRSLVQILVRSSNWLRIRLNLSVWSYAHLVRKESFALDSNISTKTQLKLQIMDSFHQKITILWRPLIHNNSLNCDSLICLKVSYRSIYKDMYNFKSKGIIVPHYFLFQRLLMHICAISSLFMTWNCIFSLVQNIDFR